MEAPNAKAITETCQEITDMLLEKNRKYGSSAFEPLRVFADTDNVEQLKVRIDDKLSRIANNNSDDEDSVKDLIGYLVLLLIVERNK